MKAAYRYLAASIIAAAAGFIYEAFSHGVYSNYMIYAFMIPLTLGALPCIMAASRGKKRSSRRGCESHISAGLQLAAVATLTAGSFLKGALEIYGTTNILTAAYPAMGAALLAAAAITAYRSR